MNAESINFQRDVIEASDNQAVLVDFWAPWCGPCRVIGPVLEKLSQEPGVSWRLIKVNVDENQDVAQMFRVSSIPAVKLFHKREVVGEFVGALPEGQVRAWLSENVPSEEKEAFKRALDLAEQGLRDQAVQILKTLVEQNAPDEARALLARLTVFENPSRAKDLIKNIELGHPAFDDAEVVRQLAQLTSMTVDDLPDNKAKTSFAAGIEALKNNDWPVCLDSFIASMAENRSYLDDLARKACISIFKYLGDSHPVTAEFRPKFSMALY